jgi:transposase
MEKKLPGIIQEEVTRQNLFGRRVRLMFQDEARFGRINDPRRCWCPAPDRPEGAQQIVREYTYAFAAVSPHDGVLDTLILPEVTAETMSLFLAEVSRRHSDEFILMIIDGAGWHHARDLKIPENTRLLFLPPYSPQLNPTEHLWDELREKDFPNLVFDSLDTLEDHLEKALCKLEGQRDRVRSNTGFDWIVNISMNAT